MRAASRVVPELSPLGSDRAMRKRKEPKHNNHAEQTKLGRQPDEIANLR